MRQGRNTNSLLGSASRDGLTGLIAVKQISSERCEKPSKLILSRVTYGEDILIYEPGVIEFGSLDQCILSPLAVYSYLKRAGSLHLLEAGWQFVRAE